MEKFSWLEFDRNHKCITRECIIIDATNLSAALVHISERVQSATVDIKVWRVHLAKT